MHRVAVAARAGADDGGLCRIFGTFGRTISENKTETMCMPISRAPATQVVFNATGQKYPQTASFTYLGGTVTKTPNLSDEIDRRIRARWMSFKCCTRELYDHPKVSLLPLKARVVRPEVIEDLLYRCATWTPLKGHYTKLRKTHHRMLLRILGAWCKSPNKRTLSYIYKDALQRSGMREHRNNREHEKVVVVGGAAPHE